MFSVVQAGSHLCGTFCSAQARSPSASTSAVCKATTHSGTNKIQMESRRDPTEKKDDFLKDENCPC